MGATKPRVALLYPGDRATRDRADPRESRFAPLFDALSAAGLAPEPAVWHDDFAAEVAAQLLQVQAVLVWCNPIEGGRRRDRLDAVLTGAARAGVLVSAHPDAVMRLGTKDVLLATRELPFGSDVQRIDSLAQLGAELPSRLARGPRVLKQYRGHSGIGVWRVEQAAGGLVKVRHAQRGAIEEHIGFGELQQRLAPYFEAEAGGHLVDQAWQPRIAEGMLRAYLVKDRVCGFGHQAVNALHPDHAQPGPRLYEAADWRPGQVLRGLLESSWIGLLRDSAGVAAERLPLLWDADFMFGPEPGSFVLCEINVSSVSPFPPSVIGPLAEAVRFELTDG